MRYTARYEHIPGGLLLDNMGREIETACYARTSGKTYASPENAVKFGKRALALTKQAYRRLGGVWKKAAFPKIEVQSRPARL